MFVSGPECASCAADRRTFASPRCTSAVTPRHVYIHVPFCVRRCSYCDFAVTVDARPPAERWLHAIPTELHAVAQREGWETLQLDTLYLGGGTPSLLGTGVLGPLRTALRPAADLAPGYEWTAEANPESFTPEIAADWRAAGVNRISLGAQTFHEPALRWMGRLHGAEGPGRAVTAARGAGFDNVSIDLIFGLPERLGRDWRRDLEQALALQPQHISLYGMTAEKGTPLGSWVAEGRERLADEDRYEEEYLLAAELLGAAGFDHYEVSNFALPGRESRHNGAYWTGVPYLGLGSGAHSYLPPYRLWNVRDWAEYRGRVEAGGLAEAERETIDGAAAALERAWLGLRTSRGIELADLRAGQRALTTRWIAAGWARAAGGRVTLTTAGWLLLDRLTVELEAAA